MLRERAHAAAFKQKSQRVRAADFSTVGTEPETDFILGSNLFAAAD